jgi:hypothetical protein
MSEVQVLERRHFLPWLPVVLVPLMVIASTMMSLAGS